MRPCLSLPRNNLESGQRSKQEIRVGAGRIVAPSDTDREPAVRRMTAKDHGGFGVPPPDSAVSEKVDARTVQRSFEPRYSTSAFDAWSGGRLPKLAVSKVDVPDSVPLK